MSISSAFSLGELFSGKFIWGTHKKHMISEYEVTNNNKHFTSIENIVYKLHNAIGSNNSYQCKSPFFFWFIGDPSQ